jgi:hypothetical protein
MHDLAYGLPGMRLLETVWKIGKAPRLGFHEWAKGVEKSHFAALCHRTTRSRTPSAIFQTVSELHRRTRRVAEFARTVRWEDFPADVRYQAIRCVLDLCGATVVGSRAKAAQRAAACQSGENSGVEVDLRWALVRPAQDEANRKVYFSAMDISIIEEAGRRLRSTPSREEQIRGYVIKLARNKGLGGEGSITISTLIEDKLRKVTVELSSAPYQRAVHAHEEDRPIACYGKLARRGKSFFLRDPRNLQIVKEDDEDAVAF